MAREHTILGLDIGTSLIKVVEMKGGPKGAVRLTGVAIRPSPPGVISNGVIVEPQVIGMALKQMLSAHGVKTRQVVCSVSGQSALVVRPIEVPRMSRQELADTMKWEVERHIPFAASEVIMDYQPLVDPNELPEGAQNMEVLLAVAQEDLVNAYLETLSVAGLEPIAIDVEPLSAARALVDIRAGEGAYEKTYALVNVGASTTDVSIIKKGGVLHFTRPIPLAGDTVTRAVAEGLGKGVEEAERLKKEYAQVLHLPEHGGPETEIHVETAAPMETVVPPEGPRVTALGQEDEEARTGKASVFDLTAELGTLQPQARRVAPEPAPRPRAAGHEGNGVAEQIARAILPTLAELVGEIRRSLEYYRTRYPAVEIDEVLLYGGTSRMPGLDRYLGTELGLAVSLADPLARVEVATKDYAPDYFNEIRGVLPISVGLAVRDMLD